MAIGEFGQLILLATLHLGQDAYGVTIAQCIEERTGRAISRSALYVTFDRLEARGLLESELRNPSEERGGQMRRYVKVTPAGLAALRESRALLVGMWRGLEGQLEGEA